MLGRRALRQAGAAVNHIPLPSRRPMVFIESPDLCLVLSRQDGGHIPPKNHLQHRWFFLARASSCTKHALSRERRPARSITWAWRWPFHFLPFRVVLKVYADSSYLRAVGGDRCVGSPLGMRALSWAQGREHALGNNSSTTRGRSLQQELHRGLPCVGQGRRGAGEGAVTSCGGSVCVHGRGEEGPGGGNALVCCGAEANQCLSLLALSPVEAPVWTAETAVWLQQRSDRIYPLPAPLTNPCFSLPCANPAVPFSVQGLVLGAPEACSQSPSSQPSRGLLPCTAQQPQPQPPQQPPPQPQGLPPAAQQQPAISNHMMSQVSCCTMSRAR